MSEEWKPDPFWNDKRCAKCGSAFAWGNHIYSDGTKFEHFPGCPVPEGSLGPNTRHIEAIVHPSMAALLLVESVVDGTLDAERTADPDAFDDAAREALDWLREFNRALASVPSHRAEGARIAGFPAKVDPSVPPDEVQIVDGKRQTVGRITGLAPSVAPPGGLSPDDPGDRLILQHIVAIRESIGEPLIAELRALVAKAREMSPSPVAHAGTGTITEEMVFAARAKASADADSLDESDPARDQMHENYVAARRAFFDRRIAHHLNAARGAQ